MLDVARLMLSTNKQVRLLVSLKAEVNHTDSSMRTPLAFGAMEGQASVRLLSRQRQCLMDVFLQPEAIRALLRCDADPNISDSSGCEPVAVAALNGHSGCVEVRVEGRYLREM